MRRHKLRAALLALALTLSLLPTPVLAAESGYRDTEGHWAEGSIDRWSGCGIVQGNNGLFDPDGALTRAQMAVILTRLLELPPADSAGFTDVHEGDWYAEFIDRCAAAGVMLGADGKASPNAPITRQQAMVMLARALGIQPVENPDLSAYKDGGAVSEYARGYVAALIEAGIVSGVGADMLGVDSSTTRAATVTILDRAITTYVNRPDTRVEAVSGGIVLVAAENVEVTGRADAVLVAQGAAGGTVTLDSVTADSVLVLAEDTAVVLDGNSRAQTVTVAAAAEGTQIVVEEAAEVTAVVTEAPESKVSVSGQVGDVVTAESAREAAVEVAKSGRVDVITAAGGKTGIAVSGKVESVTVAESAEDTTVEAGAGGVISKVDNAAKGATVSGKGKVENVTTSGDNTTVTTPGTRVEVEEGANGATAGGKDVPGGTTTTTPGSSGGSSSGGSSSGGGSSHSHRYIYQDNGDGTHTGTCSCGKKTSPEAHKVDDAGVCTACGADGFVARIGATVYKNLQEALNVGGEVVLLKDVDLETMLIVEGKVTLNMNGKRFYNTKTLRDDETPAWSLVSVRGASADLTVTGDGRFEAQENDCYAIDIQGGARCTIESGTYRGNVRAVYVHEGALSVQGGSFMVQQKYSETQPNAFVLDCDDTAYGDHKAAITVTGGKFYGFDPSANPEGADTSYVADGYISVEEGDYYKVQDGAHVSTEAELRAAVKAPTVATIYLEQDITLNSQLEINRGVTIAGANGVKKLNGDGILETSTILVKGVDTSTTVTLKDLNIIAPGGSYRTAIYLSENSQEVNIVLDNCSASAEYDTIIGDTPNAHVTIRGGTYEGRNTMQIASPNMTITVENCTLIGTSVSQFDNSVFKIRNNELDSADNAKVSFKNCRIEANPKGEGKQYLLDLEAPGAEVTLEDCTFVENDSEITEERLKELIQVGPNAKDTLQLTINGEQMEFLSQ